MDRNCSKENPFYSNKLNDSKAKKVLNQLNFCENPLAI